MAVRGIAPGEVVPDGVFRYESALFHRMLDNGGEVATAAVFHENIENPSVSVDVSVVASKWHYTMCHDEDPWGCFYVFISVSQRRCRGLRHTLLLQSAVYLARSSSQS